jgi:uncharacterized protein YndB with AHSA1/START domain
MEPIVSSIDIARAPDDVFRYATDPTCFAEWQHDVVDVRPAAAGPLGLGSRFTTVRRIGGVERTLLQEITENSPPTRWSARSIEGPIRASATITVDPLDGGSRSRVTFALDFDGHGIGVALMPLIRRQARKGAPKSYQNLKDLLEGRRASSR